MATGSAAPITACVRVDVRCVWVLRVVVCLSALFAGPVRACVLSVVEI